MTSPVRIPVALAAATLVVALASVDVRAQGDIAAQPVAVTPAAKVLAAPKRSESIFAPGVETIIPAIVDPAETVSRHPVVEVRAQKSLDWSPELLTTSRTAFNLAKNARFRRDVWQLEFGFKPLRMLRLEPADGGPQKLVWYIVYRVKNTGDLWRPVSDEQSGAFIAKRVDGGPVRFSPHFVLQAQDVAPAGGKVYRSYLDRVIPGALGPIKQRELSDRPLLTSVEMPLAPLAPGAEAWGVAMWEGIDPEIDFFSVFVRGLSNAYDWTDPPGGYAEGDAPGKGREFVRKTLQLNFWRPGDRFLQHEGEVRNGTPPGKGSLYGGPEGVAYQWVYR
ncbi:MAG: hypothetical protein ACRCT8_11500 [Lacipirellulaceae bacterium]